MYIQVVWYAVCWHRHAQTFLHFSREKHFAFKSALAFCSSSLSSLPDSDFKTDNPHKKPIAFSIISFITHDERCQCCWIIDQMWGGIYLDSSCIESLLKWNARIWWLPGPVDVSHKFMLYKLDHVEVLLMLSTCCFEPEALRMCANRRTVLPLKERDKVSNLHSLAGGLFNDLSF